MIKLFIRLSNILNLTNTLFSGKKCILLFIFIISFSLSCSGDYNHNTSPLDKNDPFSKAAYGKGNPNDDINEVNIKDPAKKKALDTLLKWMDTHTGGGHNAPTAVLALLHKGNVLVKRAFKTTNDRLYNAASHTKFFLLLSILQLADKGIIDVDDPLSKYLPIELTRKEIGSAPVTIRHVLSHTSGHMGGYKQSFRTGRGYHYSNGGYIILSKLIPELTGKSLGEYVSENIIKPLGMPNAISDKMSGAGSFKWSLEDMIIFLKMIHGRGQYNGKRIISEKWFDSEIYKPVRVGLPLAKNKTYRGICFRVLSINDRPFSINHAALFPGSGGWFHYYPKHDISFIIMTNSPTATLLNADELHSIKVKNKENGEEVEVKKEKKRFLPSVYLDPHFAGWYFPLCREVYKFMKVLSDADINPLDYRITGTCPEIVNRYPGEYINPMTGEMIDISFKYSNIIASSSTFRNKTLLSSGPNRFYPRNGNEEFYFIRYSSEKMHSLVFKNNLYIRSIPKSEIIKKDE